MKNKNFKNLIIYFSVLTLFLIGILITINFSFLKKTQYTNNLLIANIINEVQKKYPNLDEEDIIKILNNDKLENSQLLKRYGIDIEKNNISLKEEKIIKEMLIINYIILIGYIFLVLYVFVIYKKKENNKIKEITSYLKEINNNNNYKLDILKNSEDELSILKNEIYKTAVKLNEQTINLTKEKSSLKNSLSDISHQIKTPLTSMTLMIENLLKDNDVDKEKEKKMLINIHKKIIHINFLIQSLLKLSRFDADTIKFVDKDVLINNILGEVKDNLSILCDLKNVNIIIKGNKKEKIFCDYNWQVEALTNIVKNCVEHSYEDSIIEISYSSNDLFTKIIIKDYGKGIDKEDLKHIFERFYKGKNSSENSIGIGLALAKKIIEKDNGYIIVDSILKKGSTFTIKYFK